MQNTLKILQKQQTFPNAMPDERVACGRPICPVLRPKAGMGISATLFCKNKRKIFVKTFKINGQRRFTV